MTLENDFSIGFIRAILSHYIPDTSCKSVFIVFWTGIRCSFSKC